MTVNKITYGVCAILLGGIGVHKFIAGKTMAGIVYILLCWTGISALIGFIEGLIVLTKPSDENGNVEIPQGFFDFAG